MKTLNNRKGFTLLELIIVIVIMGIIMGGVVTAFVFGLNVYTDENSSVDRQENLRLVAVSFEKDLRKSATQSVTVSGTCSTIGTTITYCLVGTNVQRNGVVIAKNVDQMTINNSGTYLDLTLSSTPDDRNIDVDISTRIYLR